MKKAISLLLSLAMLAGVTALSASAEEETPAEEHQIVEGAEETEINNSANATSGKCGDNLTWTLRNGVLTISGTGAMYDYSADGDIEAPWFNNRNEIKQVILENGVTNISSGAFLNCENLMSVTIPDSVTAIGDATFYDCYNLTDVIIPNSVTAIGVWAFDGCYNLKSIAIPNGVTTIGWGAFSGAGLTSVTIPGSVECVSFGMFYECADLTDVTIMSGVTIILEEAFEGCTNLTSITIPNSVTSIDSYAFSSCSSLQDVYYTGSEEQWNKISIDSGNDELTSATIHYNYHPTDPAEVKSFVTRLYSVCLGRDPDTDGLNSWATALQSGSMTGAQAASGFIFSDEFKNKNYCNEHYVSRLYSAFMGRDADEAGLKGWVNALETGTTREEVFNGFALSSEFKNICAQYGITQGTGIAVPQYGTVPHGACSTCGKLDGVTEFVTRMYTVCLNRQPDAGGLNNWCNALWAHTQSGAGVAQGFIFSTELTNKNLNNKDFVEVLYKAFMGRDPDTAGWNSWTAQLDSGTTRQEVFNGFVGSAEFDNLCKKYGIVRG